MPVASNAIELAAPSCALTWFSSATVERSRTLTVPSALAVKSRLPRGATAIARGLLSSRRALLGSPVLASNVLRVPSSPHEIARAPSREKATSIGHPSRGFAGLSDWKRRSSLPLSRSQRTSAGSWLPVSTAFPSGENAIAVTGFLSFPP
ncbi:hypothetical protein HY251_03805 [bacterium]|nr:hypothetical protein [bacterium]